MSRRNLASLNLIVRRIPMNVIAKRSLWFSLAVLILDLALEAVTIELPFCHDNLDAWKQKLVLHTMMVAVVSICALAGGSIGLYHFPKERKLEVPQIFWIGGSFVAVVFVVDNLLAAGGLIVLFLGLTALAFIAIQSVGRWIAKRDA
jgi:hypothetical protein